MFNYIKFDLFLISNAVESGAGVDTKLKTDGPKDSNDPVEALRKKFEAVKAGEKYVGGREEKLRTSLLKDGDPQDKEFRELAEQVKKLQNEMKALGKTRQDLEGLLGEITIEIRKLSPGETEKLKTVSNKEFLNVPFEKRLQYITTAHIDASEVASGHVKGLEFTFTFDGVYNLELYQKTTAGQVLPKEVGEVKIGDEVYSRKGISGEFFTTGNKRLIIEEGTKVDIGKLRTLDELEKMRTENLNQEQLFLSQNPGSNKLVVSEAIARGIDPKFAVTTFKDLVKDTPEKELPQVLEDAFTEFDRYRGSYNISNELVNGKYNDRLAIGLLMQFSKNWEEGAKAYGISEEKIKESKSSGEAFMNAEANAIQNGDSLPDGTYLKGSKLLQNPEFSNKLNQVCANIGASRDDLIRLMKAECALDPRNVNSQSKATGLIQFMPSTATGLGTTVGKIRAMTAVEQLDYVELYFKKNSGGVPLNSIEKLYQTVFYPLSLRKGPEFVFGSEVDMGYARKVASQNGVIAKHSTRPDGLIDGYAFTKYANNHVSKFSVV